MGSAFFLLGGVVLLAENKFYLRQTPTYLQQA